MTPEEADKKQQWDKLTGSQAWRLIERYSEDWGEVEQMMQAWLRAQIRVARPEGEAIEILRELRTKHFTDLHHYEDGEGNSLRPLASRIDEIIGTSPPQSQQEKT